MRRAALKQHIAVLIAIIAMTCLICATPAYATEAAAGQATDNVPAASATATEDRAAQSAEVDQPSPAEPETPATAETVSAGSNDKASQGKNAAAPTTSEQEAAATLTASESESGTASAVSESGCTAVLFDNGELVFYGPSTATKDAAAEKATEGESSQSKDEDKVDGEPRNDEGSGLIIIVIQSESQTTPALLSRAEWNPWWNALWPASGSSSSPVELARFEGFGDAVYSSLSPAPWYASRNLITTVSFASALAPRSVASWFEGLDQLAYVKGADLLDLSGCTSMSNLFSGCKSLRQVEGIESWDVSNVRDMSGLFSNCASLESLNLSSWNVSSVTSSSGMLAGCTSLKNASSILSRFNSIGNGSFGMPLNGGASEFTQDIEKANDKVEPAQRSSSQQKQAQRAAAAQSSIGYQPSSVPGSAIEPAADAPSAPASSNVEATTGNDPATTADSVLGSARSLIEESPETAALAIFAFAAAIASMFFVALRIR